MTQPLYKFVSDTIIQRIVSGELPPGAMLPSEIDLGAELNVSQGTARKALIELEQKGIIDRRQGRGSFVTLRTPENSLFHFFRLRKPDGSQIYPKLESEVIKKRKATAEERKVLFGSPDNVFEIVRSRSYEGHPMSYEIIVVPTDIFPGLLERAPLPNTLYVLFQQAYSCAIISAEENLQASIVGKQAAELLAIDPTTPALIVRRKAIDLADRVVELRTSTYLTNEFSYAITLN